MRSRKTGGSTGIAFAEFDHSEVAEIVARSLHNYYLGGLIINTRLLPVSDVKNKKSLFRSVVPKGRKVIPTPPQSPEKKDKLRKAKMQARLKKLESLGLRQVFEGTTA